MKLLQALLFAVLAHAYGADSLRFTDAPSASLVSAAKQGNGDIAVTVSLPELGKAAQASPMALFNQLQDAIGAELESKGGKRIGKAYPEIDETGKVVGFTVSFVGVFYDDPSGAKGVGATTISGKLRCKDNGGTVTCELADKKISYELNDKALMDFTGAQSTSDPNYSFYRNKTYMHERYVHANDLERNPEAGRIRAMTDADDILKNTGKRSEMVKAHDDMVISMEARARSMDILQRAAFYRDCIENSGVVGENVPGLKNGKTLSDIKGLSDGELLEAAYKDVLKESGGNINSLRGMCYTYEDALAKNFPVDKLKDIFLNEDGKLLVSGISDFTSRGEPGDYDLSFPGLPKLMDGYRALSAADRNFGPVLKKGDQLVNDIAKQYLDTNKESKLSWLKDTEEFDNLYNDKGDKKIVLRRVPTTLIESIEIGFEIRKDILDEMRKVNNEESLLKAIQRNPSDRESGKLQDLNDELALLVMENQKLAGNATEDKMKDLVVGLTLMKGSIFRNDMENREEIIEIATKWRKEYNVDEKLYPLFIQDIFAKQNKSQLISPTIFNESSAVF